MSEIKSDKLSPSTGTSLQIGDASDTITIPTGATFTVTDGIGVASGGTGLASFTAGDILYATGSTTLAKLSKGTAEQVLAMNSGATAPDWGSVDLTVLPTITVGKGGTNIASFTAGDILYATGSTTLAKLAKGTGSQTLKMNSGATAPEWATVAAGGGKIGQVIQTVNLDTETLASATFTEIPNFAVAITPAATSSKFLVMANMVMGGESPTYTYGIQLFRDTTQIYLANAAGSRTRTTVMGQLGLTSAFTGSTHLPNFCFLDSPSSTSELDYSLKWAGQSAAVLYLNRTHRDYDSAAYDHRGASSITAIEVLA